MEAFTVDSAAGAAARAVLGPLAEGRTWLATAHLVLGFVVGSLSFPIVVALVATTAGMAVVLPLAVPFAWFLLATARVGGHVERSRFASMLGVEIANPNIRGEGGIWRRFGQRLFSRGTWKQLAYLVLRLPMGLVDLVVTVLVWSGSVVLVTLPLWLPLMHDRVAHFGLFSVSGGAALVALVLVGIAGLLAAPHVVRALTAADVWVATRLLGPPRGAQLAARVEELTVTRARAVDAAEAERRRFERDLHDGAQQRLVALAMDLGMAREKFATDPDAARSLVDEAHDEAKQALVELRHLVRGLHPAILADRGLDAALSALAARAPVPVDVRVDIGDRPSEAVESAAYFVVSEALANIAKHAEASSASVRVVRSGGRLVIEVTDDGRGGATVDGGTGLRGLADRVAALDGWLHVVSPVGGPTTLLVEIPCAS